MAHITNTLSDINKQFLKVSKTRIEMKSFLLNTLNEASKYLTAGLKDKRVIEYKSANGTLDFNQIVTDQDLMIENFIIERIEKQFTKTNIISEEKAKNDFSLNAPTWVIDPIDGSMNFYRGLNFYCISLSYWEKNEPKFAGVISPYNNEIFYAEKGKGATLNNIPIHTSDIGNLNESIIFLSGYESFKKHKKDSNFSQLLSGIKNMRIFSSSTLDMCYVAAGRCEGRIYSNCKFWDLAATKLILEEAGGKLTDWDGTPNSLFSPFVIASNNHIHDKLIKLINDNYSR